MIMVKPALLRRASAALFLLCILSACAVGSITTPQPNTSPFVRVDSGEDSFVYRTVVDRRAFRVKTLGNGLQVLMISDPDAHDSAVAMQVDVGSGADPQAYQGLAHFLEHMLFLGSGEYPNAGEFSEFTARNAGSDNAFTSPDATVYFFKVRPEALAEGADRFSGFFTDPLFTEEYIQREINAVDAEYFTRAEHEGLKIFEASKSLMTQGHPMQKLSVGNLETLLGGAGENDREREQRHADLRAAMLDFYQRHYYAQNMRLAIVGPQGLDEMESLLPAFSNIRSLAVAQNAPARAPVYSPEVLPLWEPVAEGESPPLLLVETRQPVRVLVLRFALQDVVRYLPSKSMNYVLDVLGHEGRNSLLSTLRKRGLATGVSAGSGFNFHHSAVLTFDIELTERGMGELPLILELFYATVDSIRAELSLADGDGAQTRYAEQALLANLNARFSDTPDVLRAALGAVASPRFYPLPLTFVSPFWFEGFDRALKLELLSNITPENSQITLASDQLETAFAQADQYLDRKTHWYPVRFGVLDASIVGSCSLEEGACSAWEPTPGFGLPRANRYIPSSFAIKNPVIEKAEQNWQRPKPAIAAINDWGRVWYLPDNAYGKPLADYMLLLRREDFLNAREIVLQSLYAEWVRELLTEPAYEAYLAGQNYRISNHPLGLTLTVSGYNDNLQAFLADVLHSTHAALPDEDAFLQIKSTLAQGFERRRLSDPMTRLSIALEESLDPLARNLQEFQRELAAIRLADLHEHIKNQHEFVRIDLIAHGNLDQKDVDKLLQLPCQKLNCATALQFSASKADTRRVESMQPKTRKLDRGVSRSSIEVFHNDSASWWYFQAPGDSVKEQMQTYLLGDLLSQPFYRELRTERQLGYIVSAGGRIDNELAGLNLTVQSARYDNEFIDAAIGSQVDRWLAMMASGEGVFASSVIEQHRQALLERLKRPDASLHDRSAALFRSLLRGDTGFKRQLEMVEVLESLDLDEFRAYSRDLLAKESRRLLILTADPAENPA